MRSQSLAIVTRFDSDEEKATRIRWSKAFVDCYRFDSDEVIADAVSYGHYSGCDLLLSLHHPLNYPSTTHVFRCRSSPTSHWPPILASNSTSHLSTTQLFEGGIIFEPSTLQSFCASAPSSARSASEALPRPPQQTTRTSGRMSGWRSASRTLRLLRARSRLKPGYWRCLHVLVSRIASGPSKIIMCPVRGKIQENDDVEIQLTVYQEWSFS